MLGENTESDGHFITVWAPRQRGKTWVMQQVVQHLAQNEAVETVVLSLQHLQTAPNLDFVVRYLGQTLQEVLGLNLAPIKTLPELEHLFRSTALTKPLILIFDEFDALPEEAISGLAGLFRNIHIQQQYQRNQTTTLLNYRLHSVALIGVRAVLGIENKSGSPFNVQHSLHIPNLTFPEVETMFREYEKESGQKVEQDVIDRVFYETQGQPGLVGWLGELLTETYNKHNPTITLHEFEIAYAAAINTLPNSNIINIISKAKQAPYKNLVLHLFQSDEKIPFRYDDPETNFLYLNGVVDEMVEDETKCYMKFSCPFVQKRLFNYFAGEIFGQEGQLYPPFTDLSETITETALHVANILKLHQTYIQKNKSWLYQNAPRRADLRLYEAVYHFNLYTYLKRFMLRYGGEVWPEFPTGNGQIDLVIRYANQIFALEVKSFSDHYEYKKGLTQAAGYAHKLQLKTITLVLFVEAVDEASRQQYETPYTHPETGIVVEPCFVITTE